jgi:hypothetical protein
MITFIAGLVTMGYIVAAAFFLRFWQRTGDYLFAIFALSFVLFALNQLLAAVLGLAKEDQSWLYLLRLSGFVALIVGILVKNFSTPKRS